MIVCFISNEKHFGNHSIFNICFLFLFIFSSSFFHREILLFSKHTPCLTPLQTEKGSERKLLIFK